MIIQSEEILGVYDGEELLCVDCAQGIEGKFDDPERLLLSKTVEGSDDLFFCDRCRKPIKAVSEVQGSRPGPD